MLSAYSPTQERLAAEYRARQAKYAAAARNAANNAKPALVLLQSPKRDIEIDRPQQDAHCVSYRSALPDLHKVGMHRLKRYVVVRCHELGVSCWNVFSGFKSDDVVKARDQIVWEIKAHVKPEMSWPELGRLFCRDHSSVISSFHRGAARNGDEGAAERVRQQRAKHAQHHRDRKARGE